MKLKMIEKETVISYNQKEGTAFVETYDGRLMKRIEMLAGEYPDLYRVVRKTEEDGQVSGEYVVPRKSVRISKPKVVDEEVKKKYAQILEKARDGNRNISKMFPDSKIHNM